MSDSLLVAAAPDPVDRIERAALIVEAVLHEVGQVRPIIGAAGSASFIAGATDAELLAVLADLDRLRSDCAMAGTLLKHALGERLVAQRIGRPLPTLEIDGAHAKLAFGGGADQYDDEATARRVVATARDAGEIETPYDVARVLMTCASFAWRKGTAPDEPESSFKPGLRNFGIEPLDPIHAANCQLVADSDIPDTDRGCTCEPVVLAVRQDKVPTVDLTLARR